MDGKMITHLKRKFARSDTINMDFETYSKCDIKKAGAWRYSEDPSTIVLCLSYTLPGDTKPRRWIRGDDMPGDLFEAIATVEEVWAFNAPFEYAIWKNVCVKRMGWNKVPFKKWRCSAALARIHALPGNLEGAALALKTGVDKDKRGSYLIRMLCKPQKPRKIKNIWPLFDKQPVDPEKCKFDGVYYSRQGKRQDEFVSGLKAGLPKFKNVYTIDSSERNTDPKLLEELYAYCDQDVMTERALTHFMNPWIQSELQIWRYDLRSNERGVHLDIDLLNCAYDLVQEACEKYESEAIEIGGGEFTTLGQREKVIAWCASRGYYLDDYTADTLEQSLKDPEIPEDVFTVLQARAITSRTSTKKFGTMKTAVCEDEMIRGILLYYGAHTGRWAGRLIQPQNLPRPDTSLSEADIEYIISLIRQHNLDAIELLYGDPMSAIVSCIRPLIIPRPGKKFYCADYSNIEGRVSLWMARDDDGLDIFRDGRDMYIETATEIYGLSYEKIEKEYKSGNDDKRRMGKLAVLGLGYGMGVKKFIATCAEKGVIVTEEFAQTVVDAYRTKFSKVKNLWYKLNNSAISAVKNKGKECNAGPVSFIYKEVGVQKTPFLLCKLPNGRYIHYPYPEVRQQMTPWGEPRDQLTYMTVEKKKWMRTSTFGGKILENIVQAASRDLLTNAMFNCLEKGYWMAMSVHDELVTEKDDGTGSKKELEDTMGVLPPWAKGLPLVAKGWEGYYFRK